MGDTAVLVRDDERSASVKSALKQSVAKLGSRQISWNEQELAQVVEFVPRCARAFLDFPRRRFASASRSNKRHLRYQTSLLIALLAWPIGREKITIA